MKAALLKLLAALGVTLADTATDDEITATLNAAADSATKKASLEKEEEATGMSAKFNALSAEFDGFKKQALIDQATAAGKAIPLSAEELKITPLSVVKTLCDAAPAGSVPLSKESKTTETPTKAEPLSAECVKLAAAMGMSPEDVVKYSAQ